jgi:PAS domain-containing protein
MMTIDETLRRWTPIIDRIKTRLAHRSASMAPRLEAALDEAAATLDILLQDLAGAETANRNLRSRITRLENEWVYLFQRMPVACVVTDASGTIVRANQRAADLLNMSVRHLQNENRPLTYFVQDREPFFALLTSLASAGENARTALRLRPRERAPVMVDMFAVPHMADDGSLWLWFIAPSSPQCTEIRNVTAASVSYR